MSRYRRRVRDDLVDVVFDVIRSATPPDQPMDAETARIQAEREAARQAAKAEARKRRELHAIRSYIGAGVGLAAGGLSSMLVPTVAAVGIGILAGGLAQLIAKHIQENGWPGARLALPRWPERRPEIAPPEVDGRNLARSQRDLVQGVLDDAALDMKKLDDAARALERRDPESAELCDRLVRAAGRVSDAIADAPQKFGVAQRKFTYFLPRAVLMAESLVNMPDGADPRRREEHRHMLAQVDHVFEKALLDLSEVDAAEMDVEMRLLKQALDEELGGKDRTP